MTSRSSLLLVFSVLAAAAACSSGDAGFSTRSDGGGPSMSGGSSVSGSSSGSGNSSGVGANAGVNAGGHGAADSGASDGGVAGDQAEAGAGDTSGSAGHGGGSAGSAGHGGSSAGSAGHGGGAGSAGMNGGAGTGAVDGLDVTGMTNLDGDVTIEGTVHVYSTGTLSSATGSLTLHADAIVVDAGGTITVAATGLTPDGKGGNACGGNYGAGGGAYGTVGLPAPSGAACNGIGGTPWGLSNDSFVSPGSPGGDSAAVPGADGGGVLRLIAGTIDISGTIAASGASSTNSGGAGSGGGILLAASKSLRVAGSVSAAGGLGWTTGGISRSGNGGAGRVKLLYGTTTTITGAIVGTRTDGLLPPLTLGSTAFPDPTLSYNDDFDSADFSWNRPFSGVQGYYGLVDATASTLPASSNATLVSGESESAARSAFAAGTNYAHIVPIGAQSLPGTVQSWFKIQINTLGPTITSSSHPSQTTWTLSSNPSFQWTLPNVSDASLSGWYYVLDHFADTVPTTSATPLPVTPKQLLLTAQADGIWVFHLLSVDTQGRLTKLGSHYQVRVGMDPGSSSLSGKVTDGLGLPVSGATVSINRGLFTSTTNALGSYAFSMYAGSWEMTVSNPAYAPVVKQVTVTKNLPSLVNVTLN